MTINFVRLFSKNLNKNLTENSKTKIQNQNQKDLSNLSTQFLPPLNLHSISKRKIKSKFQCHCKKLPLNCLLIFIFGSQKNIFSIKHSINGNFPPKLLIFYFFFCIFLSFLSFIYRKDKFIWLYFFAPTKIFRSRLF